jgi:uncharacterized protein
MALAPVEGGAPESVRLPLAPLRMLNVELVYGAGPHQLQQWALQLPAGSSVADAVAASGLLETTGLIDAALRLGVWGKLQELGHLLREGDRVEVYRSLLVDPKEARRLRYAQHKAKLASMGPPRLTPKKQGA